MPLTVVDSPADSGVTVLRSRTNFAVWDRETYQESLPTQVPAIKS